MSNISKKIKSLIFLNIYAQYALTRVTNSLSFKIIDKANSKFLTFSNIQPCLDTLGDIMHIQALLGHIKPYSGIFRTLYNPCIYSRAIFRTQGIFNSLLNIKDDQAYSEPWHSQNSLFNHFQGYFGMFRYIDAYSAKLTGLLGGVGGGLPCPFWKSKKVFQFCRKKVQFNH